MNEGIVESDAEKRLERILEALDRLSTYIARSAELILVASAFGYAAVRTSSVAAGVVALLVSAVAAGYIWFHASYVAGYCAGYASGYWGGRRDRLVKIVRVCSYLALAALFVVCALGAIDLYRALVLSGL